MFAAACLFSLASCGSEDKPSVPPTRPSTPTTPPTPQQTAFAKGADVSWLTEMEAANVRFYNTAGTATECMSLLKQMGFNSIRLRVWVNPQDAWNGTADVVAKALRAKTLGLRVMIDFHYSDTWADPGHQTPPAAWASYNLAQMTAAVADHTKAVLTALKNNSIDIEWVQVGNETPDGMLYPLGNATSHMNNFAKLEAAGYDAVKEVYPDAKVIVHVDQGDKLSRFTWLFDGLKNNGGKWDVVGMSLYPEDSDWQSVTTQCLNNIATLANRYGTPVMLCEVGMPWDSANAEACMAKLAKGTKDNKQCLGIFYWEPQCYNGWKSYTKGAFDNTGKPTAALKALVQ